VLAWARHFVVRPLSQCAYSARTSACWAVGVSSNRLCCNELTVLSTSMTCSRAQLLISSVVPFWSQVPGGENGSTIGVYLRALGDAEAAEPGEAEAEAPAELPDAPEPADDAWAPGVAREKPLTSAVGEPLAEAAEPARLDDEQLVRANTVSTSSTVEAGTIRI
jgi:hypothetical protein